MRSAVGGIIVIDKPAGISSAQVVATVKKATGAKKAGHAGTLDPFATGVLVCCLNQATRLAGFFLKGDKRYEALIRLGITTDTQDATGKITARAPEVTVDRDRILRVLTQFEGPIEQTPPVYSALKHKGVPLYKLARKGTPVQKPARRVTISGIRVTAMDLPEIRLEIRCSAGTYIRTLSADIGQALGCGGHLKALRRSASSGFTIAQALSLEAVQNLARAGKLAETMIPMSKALTGMPKLVADVSLVHKISHGQRLGPGDIAPPDEASTADGFNGKFQVVDRQGRLVAVMESPPKKGQENIYNYCCVFHYENAK